jgi:hypothetical protein
LKRTFKLTDPCFAPVRGGWQCVSLSHSQLFEVPRSVSGISKQCWEKPKPKKSNMNMKSYTSISIAVLTALSLYPPWAGVQNCNAETNTVAPPNLDAPTNAIAPTNTDPAVNTDAPAGASALTNVNLYRARINLVCTTTNADGTLDHDRVITSEFVRDAAVSVGVTNVDDLALAYNPSNSSLEVVNRTTREVIATPLNFDGGTSVANADNTRVVLQKFVFLNSETVASGLLSATQRLAYADSGELRTFGMRGSIYYNFANGTNSPTICQGILAVGSGISQRGNRNQDIDDDDDNNSIPGRGNDGNNANNGNNRNNVSTNVINPGLGSTNLNPRFSITNLFPGLGTTNVNPRFGTTNLNPGFGTTTPGFGFGTTNINPGFGITNNPVFGITNTSPSF